MKKRLLCLLALGTLMCTSCMTTYTNVRGYQPKETDATYSKAKQLYLFWGLLPLGYENAATPADGACQVKTQTTFVDGFVTTLTGGLFTMQTITVIAPKGK